MDWVMLRIALVYLVSFNMVPQSSSEVQACQKHRIGDLKLAWTTGWCGACAGPMMMMESPCLNANVVARGCTQDAWVSRMRKPFPTASCAQHVHARITLMEPNKDMTCPWDEIDWCFASTSPLVQQLVLEDPACISPQHLHNSSMQGGRGRRGEHTSIRAACRSCVLVCSSYGLARAIRASKRALSRIQGP